MPLLGVNIDHVATLRQARGGKEPGPVAAAAACEAAGAHSIVVHLREDRRHINDDDVFRLRKTITTRLNLEMSVNKEIVAVARKIVPDQATLVPEKRKELTTEGGLDVAGNKKKISSVVSALQSKGIVVSLFIDPVKKQIEASRWAGAAAVELHTGRYAESVSFRQRRLLQQELVEAVRFGRSLGLTVHAGHGLNYDNVGAVAAIPGIEELNIGHAIISRAVFVGLGQAVKEMVELIQ